MKSEYLIPIIDFCEHVMAEGQGSYLIGESGKRFIDLNSGQFCTVLGHGNDDFQEKVFSKVSRLAHTASDIISVQVLECAEKMNRISGEMDARTISLSTGSEAVEFALRYAKHITGKDGVICFDKGYHGLTLGSQSITYGGRFTKPHVENTYSVSIPSNDADEAQVQACLQEVKDVVDEHKDEIALIILEPIVSVGGLFYPPASYFQGVRKICDDNGILFTLDESQTGFGRLGVWFGYQRIGVVPDIVVLSKGVGIGFPIAFVMMAKSIIPDEGFKMTHYSSHQNDAFAGAITGAAIDYIEENNILARVESTGAYYLNRLVQLSESNEHFINPRGVGLMLGGEFYFEGVNDYRRIYHELRNAMMDEGVIIQGTNGGHTFRSLPDYLIEEQAIDEAVAVLDSVLKQRNWSEYE